MPYQAPTGTQDILPQDQPYWRYVIGKMRHIAGQYGFQEIDVPIFEDTSLFARGVGEATDIVEKEMYTFEDRGGRSLTLRPEFTAGVMRAYVEHGMRVLPSPVRLYSIGPAFRYERPQAGRYRQFWQLNVESIGEQDPAADLEIMSVAWHIYADLGFKSLSFQLNSTGCPRCKPGYSQILAAYYRRYHDLICQDCRRRLETNPLRVLDCKQPQCQPVIESAPRITDHLCDECQAHFAALLGYLDELDRPYTLNHRLVRGLDYYTKTVFEVWAEGIGAQNAVCGGGRYDGLIELIGGPATAGVGFATGIERIILTLQQQGVQPPPLPRPTVMLAFQGEAAKRAAVRILDRLRSADVAAVMSLGDRSLKAQLRQAGRQEMSLVLILGQDEITAGQVTVRDMAHGQQQRIDQDDIVRWLQGRLMNGA
ncbi:MAG: histidine--tRNA ligase [Chloroflexota bacterium]